MAFTIARTDQIEQIGSGERGDAPTVIYTTDLFEDELKRGRFAKWASNQLDNMDGSATPVIAGVVLRSAADSMEDGDTIDKSLYSQAQYVRFGLVTVDVKSGETPAALGRVYISNAGDASDGMATATATDIAVNAEFVREVKTGVWEIFINPPQGDVATHIGDATAAHAASAISVADVATVLTATDVEAALNEIYDVAADHIADTTDAHDASAVSILDTADVFTGVNVETVSKELYDKIQAHEDDTSAAHAASAVSFDDTSPNVTGNTVQLAIVNVADNGAALSLKVVSAVADPGDAQAIPVTASASVALTTTGAETRTLAIPAFAGQSMELCFDVDGGDCVVTVASPINSTGNNTITFDTAGQCLFLKAVQIAGVLAWRIVQNVGSIALTTV